MIQAVLTNEQFFEALEKGHGRALMHVREHGDEGLEDEVRRACLYDLRYDLQTTESRVPWIAEILDACRGDTPYRRAVYAALDTTVDSLSWHLSQRCSLTKHWAASGDSTARKTLYDAPTPQLHPGRP